MEWDGSEEGSEKGSYRRNQEWNCAAQNNLD